MQTKSRRWPIWSVTGARQWLLITAAIPGQTDQPRRQTGRAKQTEYLSRLTRMSRHGLGRPLFCEASVIAENRRFTWELIAINRRLPAAPPIKHGSGYRSRTLNLNPNPKTDPNPNPKVTIMYGVQNDTEIKFNIVLYIYIYNPTYANIMFITACNERVKYMLQ